MAEQADVLGRIVEPLGDDPGGEAVNKRGAQGLIAALPIEEGMDKKRGIVHDRCYII